ncbi:serpin family protein [Candidatus Fermentibacterales bacterium]|nr:serpin family protein [Candidatus Fermentibacterales bacterium]
MRTILTMVLATVMQFQGSCDSEPQPQQEGAAPDLPALVEGNTGFALALFERLCAESPAENLFFSPYSVSCALGMTWAGARGETESQMTEVLGFSLPQASLHASFAELGQKLDPEHRASRYAQDAEPLTLEVANAIWVQSSFPLLDEYVDLVEREYGAEARNVDFRADPESQRILINDWVAGRTRDRIRDLLAPGTITTDTRVVLTNAVYFKASWMSQFDEYSTWSDEFTLPDGFVIEVPMMHQTESFPYYRGCGCTAVSLPYSDGQSSMLLLLPDGEIGELEGSLDPEDLRTIGQDLRNERISLAVPSFEFTSSFSLKETLEGMGMTNAFDSDLADFTGFTGHRDLYISAVIHKAFVKVDETGTEAAAATAVVMALAAAPPPPVIEVSFDRPFLFLVMDDLTGSILFMGRVADPSI